MKANELLANPKSPGAWIVFILICLCIFCFVLPRFLELMCFSFVWILSAPYCAWYEYQSWNHQRKRVCPQPQEPALHGVVVQFPAPNNIQGTVVLDQQQGGGGGGAQLNEGLEIHPPAHFPAHQNDAFGHGLEM